MTGEEQDDAGETARLDAMLNELAVLRQQVRDLTVRRLMDINREVYAYHLETVAEGDMPAAMGAVFAALDAAVLETVLYVNALPEGTNDNLGVEAMVTYLAGRAAATEDYNAYRAYTILANQFRHLL